MSRDIPPEFLITNFNDRIAAIVESTYPNLLQHYKDEDFLQCRAILASTIEVAGSINDFMLGLIPGDEREYLSADLIDRSEANGNEAFDVIPSEFLNSLTTSGLPNFKIKLKVGTPITLLKDLNPSEGLCIGTRLIVTRLANFVLQAKIISGKNIGNLTLIPRISMSPLQSPWPFKLIRRQFPIVVSYAMTINESQGQSFDYVGIYLPNPGFSHEQLYEAVSRVKSRHGLKILINDKDKQTLETTSNVVYKVFQNI